VKGLSRIVESIASLVFIPILVFGLYIMVHGHLTPGGGFQGGAIVGSAIAMIFVAYGTIEANKHFKLTSLLSIMAGAAVVYLLLKEVFSPYIKDVMIGTPFMGRIPEGINIGHIASGTIFLPLNVLVGLIVLSGFGIVVVLFNQLGGNDQ